LSLQKRSKKLAVPISSAFQTGFVATIVHTMNAAVAAIRRINTPQQPQQTGLILNYPSHVTCNHHENTILGARFRVRLIADALIRPPIFRGQRERFGLARRVNIIGRRSTPRHRSGVAGRPAMHRKQPFSLQSGQSALGQPSSARRPASVILTRPTARLPALMFSRCAVASPARMRLASIRRLKPCANIIASLTPNGLLARNWSARRCSAPR